MSSQSRAQVINKDKARCPYCHDTLELEAEKQGCPQCMAWHHADCWREHGQCASCGHSTETQKTPVAKPSSSRQCLHHDCQNDIAALNNGSIYAELLGQRCAEHMRSELEFGQIKVYGLALLLMTAALVPFIKNVSGGQGTWALAIFVLASALGALAIGLVFRALTQSTLEELEKLPKPRKKTRKGALGRVFGD